MTYTYTDICTHQRWFLVNPPLASRSYFSLPLLHDSTPLFTYLEILLLLLGVRIPILSCPWLAVNCSPLAASPTPGHPTDQVTYLHRLHQQHQPSRLTQLYPGSREINWWTYYDYSVCNAKCWMNEKEYKQTQLDCFYVRLGYFEK